MIVNPYHHFVSEFARLVSEGRAYPLGTFAPLPRPQIPRDAPRVLIFSPHPDDEVIIGGLALRLLHEAQWNIINVAVTRGSKRERQAERLEELRRCCDCIGFGLVQTAPTGLEKVNPAAREQQPDQWAQSVRTIAALLEKERPKVILFPHDLDWNSTHVGTHLLVMDALKSLPQEFSCHAVETEFWGQNPSPNLMLELSAKHVADLITALTCHVGEVKRNPYHLLLPAWMMDSVRRGAELVGGQGGASPEFVFATLYRHRRWQGGRLINSFEGGKFCGCGENVATFFD